jgi:hypothetical protein
MYNLIKRLADGFAGLIVGLAVAAVLMGPAAMALVFPGQYAPRYFPTQQTHYERHLITITSTGFTGDTAQNTCAFAAATNSNCSLRIGAVPYNSFLVRAYLQVITPCNSSATCTLALGTSSGNAGIVAATTIFTGTSTTVTSPSLVGAGSGTLVTGNNIASTGADGGFDLYATVAFTATAPTTGVAVIVLEYFGPNDGGCNINVPIPTLANTVGPC